MHGVGRREGGAQVSLVRARADRGSEAAAAHPIAQQRRAQPDGRRRTALAGRRHAYHFCRFYLLLPLDLTFKFGKGLLRVLSFDV